LWAWLRTGEKCNFLPICVSVFRTPTSPSQINLPLDRGIRTKPSGPCPVRGVCVWDPLGDYRPISKEMTNMVRPGDKHGIRGLR